MRVLVVDTEASTESPPAITLEPEPGRLIKVHFASWQEAPAALHDVDVAVVDFALLEREGLDPVCKLLATNPRAGVLITGRPDQPDGVTDEATKPTLQQISRPIVEVVCALRRAADSNAMAPAARRLDPNPEAQAALARLTAREKDVLQALAAGLTDRQISRRLGVSAETVRTHMAHILNKLGVRSRVQALLFAARHGAVTID